MQGILWSIFSNPATQHDHSDIYEDPDLAVKLVQYEESNQFICRIMVMYRMAQSHSYILQRSNTNFIVNMDDTHSHKYFSLSLLNLEQLEDA